jgi:hypothetical protein
MQSIKKTLDSNIKKYNLQDKMLSIQVCKLWEKVIGEYIPNSVGKTMAMSLEKGVLTIAALSRDVVEQIRMYRDRLLYALNTYLGSRAVFAIRCEY